MNTPGESRSEQARQFYNAAASASQDFAFMNYGYAPLGAELASSAEPEKYCLQLYRHLIGSTVLAGKKSAAAAVAARRMSPRRISPRATSASTSASAT